MIGILNMLFKSLGVAIATNNASNSDQDLKPITIRLADSEIQLYDTVSKSMGLTRQDFLSRYSFQLPTGFKRICSGLYKFKSLYAFVSFI